MTYIINKMSENISLEQVEQNINKRSRCDYNLLQQDIMKLRKQNVLNELEILKLTGKSVIFENQEIIAYKVVTAFKNRKIINIMVKNKRKQKGGRTELIDYNRGGVSLGNSAGFVPFVENIAGGIIWTINSIIASTNTIGSIMSLGSDMGTAWGPNVPPDLK